MTEVGFSNPSRALNSHNHKLLMLNLENFAYKFRYLRRQRSTSELETRLSQLAEQQQANDEDTGSETQLSLRF